MVSLLAIWLKANKNKFLFARYKNTHKHLMQVTWTMIHSIIHKWFGL